METMSKRARDLYEKNLNSNLQNYDEERVQQAYTKAYLLGTIEYLCQALERSDPELLKILVEVQEARESKLIAEKDVECLGFAEETI
jgi:hypothetical protein